MAARKPLKVVSEATRERETFKYDPFIFAGFTFNRDGKVPPSHELSTASDSVLTALAQLGAYQTGTDRAFVSFFDPSHQYIVAEATPSMRIAPNLPSEGCPEPLSLCGTAIPRQQGTCDHVLFMSSPSDAADAAELPLSFVPNLATDSRFSSRPYCQFGDTGQFYASVPVRTARGVNIGAYCVMSSTQPKSWDDQSTQHLRDISLAIADHLELKRSKFEARNHARVNRGLGSLIAGKGTLTGWQFAANAEAFQNDAASEGALNVAQQHSESQEEHRKPEEERLANLEDEDSANQQETAKHRAPSPPPSNMQRISVSDDDGSGLIFSKAANIIREAFEVEGSVFLDVAVGSYKRPLSSPTEEIPNSNKTPSLASMSSSSDEQTHTSSARMPDDGSCDLLGFSTTDASSVDVSTPMDGNRIVMPKRFLAKLLRRYPNGRIFNFDAIGELETSDSSGDDDVVVASSGSVGSSQITVDKPRQPLDSTRGVQHGKRYGRSQEGTLIHQAFPGARSVAFIPVWDPKRERWFAGGFMYTLHPTRVFSADNELAFLGAFAKLIAAEVLNSETLKADKAKSDILGSLSHELRSPLHGVILSTDLLNDTDLSVFQGNAIHTIETCGRTLLDTIEHLLDYSKINSFAATETSAISNPRGQRKRNKSDFFGKKSLFSHTRLDALVEDVVESVFAGFNFQYMSIRQMVKKHKTGHADTAAHRRLDAELAMEQLGSSLNDEHEKRVVFGNTSVYITIDPTCDWTFYIQPGALRRIVMNLLGNSLKYTTCGTIRVSLGQQQAGRSSAERFVTLTVHDTGRGMSEDYLRHKLFRPFSQEDELMPGTGLGLSLVKRITSQLHGQISVESQLGVGTTIAVTLPLEPTSPKSKSMRELVDDDTDFKNQVCQLTNLRVRLQGFGPEWGRDGRLLVEDICHRWLHLDLVSDLDKAPEIILWSEDALPTSFGDMGQLARVPNVVVCRDALAAYRLWTRHEHVGRTRVFEYISQPLGPRALARSLLLAYGRWADVPKAPPVSRRAVPNRAPSPHTERRFLLNLAAEGLSLGTSQLQKPEVHFPMTADGAISAASESEEASTAPDGQLHVARAPESSRREAHKFLLVDDNRINLKVLSAYMSKLGQAYEAAINGKEAVDAYIAEPNKFAGILMDISMPVMDGLEATRQIRAHEHRDQLHPVVILALTGLASNKIHEEALESGVDMFLTKPVGLSVLKEALRAGGLFPEKEADAAV